MSDIAIDILYTLVRAAIRDGDEALARGDVTEVDSDRKLDEFFAEL
jgi:hypothetical protein